MQEILTPKERLEKVILYLGITPSVFSKKLGVNSQVVFQYLYGKNKNVSLNFAKAVSDAYPEISFSWLLSGKGDMMESGDKSYQSINGVINVNSNGGINLTGNIHGNDLTGLNNVDLQLSAPIIPDIICDTRDIDIMTYPDISDWPKLSIPSTFSDTNFVYRVCNNDMRPYFFTGDYLFLKKVDISVIPSNGLFSPFVVNSVNGVYLSLLCKYKGEYVKATYTTTKDTEECNEFSFSNILNIFKIVGSVRLNFMPIKIKIKI